MPAFPSYWPRLALATTAFGLVACPSPAASPSKPTSEALPHWSYAGHEGPAEWGHLHPAYATCGTGEYQSPIDLDRATLSARTDDIAFAYRAAPATVVDNGHTVEVRPKAGDGIKLGAHAYRLAQLHLHAPSEHAIDHQRHTMEVHLVHRDDRGNLAVVAVLVDEGEADDRLAPFFAHLPEGGGPPETIPTLDPAWFLPEDRRHYRYYGSLTTPPCTEGVRWTVMATPIHLSLGQISAFRAHYRANARPIQARADSCLSSMPKT